MRGTGTWRSRLLQWGRAALIVVSYIAVFWGALPALLWAAGSAVDALLGMEPFMREGWRVTGAALLVLGIGLMGWAMGLLWFEGRGLPISHLPPSQLVARGPYRAMRHPIYVGYTLAAAGVGLLSGSPGRSFASPLLLTAGWMAYARWLEEPRLIRRFGPAYRDYLARMPLLRWPPLP